MSKKAPKVQPPEEFTGITHKKPKQVAGGMPAVVSALRHVFGEVGVADGVKSMLKINQIDGFDCPGCAWPDPDKERSSLGEFCENGAKAIAEEATKKRADSRFFQKYSISELSQWSDFQIGKSGRLTDPMLVEKGETHYQPISWQGAFDIIGTKLQKLASPNEAIFYTSGRTSNEAAFLYQLFVREYGTNNLPDCSNMCHESSGVALTETVGIGKGSVTLDDFYKADLIIVSGQNPGTNHPRMLTALQKAKRNGCKIITINPLEETGLVKFKHPQSPIDMLGRATAITDLFLQVKINADVPLIKAILILLLKREENEIGSIFDHEFIENHTDGCIKLINDLRKYDVGELVKMSGVELHAIKEAVELIASSNNIIACWAMGLTQHKNAVDNIRELVNLLLLKGSIGREGAGTCPVRGHSNVQGDRTMGIYEKPSKEFLDKLQEVFGFDPPREHGYDTVEAIQAMYQGKAKVFIGLGGNFLSATPDTEYTAKALQNCDMTVHISTKLNRSHLIHGKTALILPCLGRTEQDIQATGKQFVSVENSTGVVHQSQGSKRPISDNLMSEPSIVAGIAKSTLLNNTKINWTNLVKDYDLIRELISVTIFGFGSYNLRVREPGGFYLPNGARKREFKTTNRKANFTLNALPDHQLANDEYLMMTIRTHDQFNTTIYGLNDRYRGIYNERRVVMINDIDMMEAGLQAMQVVDLVSTYDGVERVARKFLIVPYNIPRRCIATYFPEANVLVPVNHYARKSQTPISKSVVVKIIPH